MKVGEHVLILVSRRDCRVCELYKSRYLRNTLVQLPKGKINFFVLNVTQDKLLPDCFVPYVTAYPTLLLLPWKEYTKVFDKMNVYDPLPDNFSCKCFGMEHGIRSIEIMETFNPVESVKNWINFEIS